MPDLIITVYGTPAPQGSKRAFAVRGKRGVPTGRVAVIESSHDRVKSWRQAVIDAAAEHRPVVPLAGPLELEMTFYLRRPKSHFGTGKNTHVVKTSAPRYPVGMPDLSKLARSTEDALTDAGIWHDDAQIVRYTRLAKDYAAAPEPGALAGALIIIRLLEKENGLG